MPGEIQKMAFAVLIFSEGFALSHIKVLTLMESKQKNIGIPNLQTYLDLRRY